MKDEKRGPGKWQRGEADTVIDFPQEEDQFLM